MQMLGKKEGGDLGCRLKAGEAEGLGKGAREKGKGAMTGWTGGMEEN